MLKILITYSIFVFVIISGIYLLKLPFPRLNVLRLSVISIFISALVLFTYYFLITNNSKLRTIQLSTKIDRNKKEIIFNWDRTFIFSNITIFRRENIEDAWGEPIASINGLYRNFTDTSIVPGKKYEYLIKQKRLYLNAKTFISAGIDIPEDSIQKKIIILVEKVLSENLQDELAQLYNDIACDGWNILSITVDKNTPCSKIKETIINEYNKDNTLSSVFIIGHVAIPYSGAFAFDWHPNHKGAWPADTYYATLNENWTDSSINYTKGLNQHNTNIPGDEKFDQSFLSTIVNLEIGRIDFSDLPIYKENEIELTRRYLKKNHSYRSGKMEVSGKAIVFDQFHSIYEKRANASSGWRNFTALFGKENIVEGYDFKQMIDSSYIFSYSCGSGSNTSMGSLVTSDDFASKKYQNVFCAIFGSYFGDWNTSNNLMRVALASESDILATMWVGHPAWFFHHMSLGNTIGYSGKISVNNNGEYITHKANRGIHMSMLGDPTLRLFMSEMDINFSANNFNDSLILEWKSNSKSITGFNLYASDSRYTDYKKIYSVKAINDIHSFSIRENKQRFYKIRAIVLQNSASGSFFNELPGKIIEINNLIQPSR